MKKVIYFFFFILCCTTAMTALAHTPVLMLEDNEDGTVTVEGGFSTGAGAEGVMCYVKTIKDGKILLSQQFPESSSITVEIPEEPYLIIFDGGPGHKIVKKGPQPLGGFKVNADAVNLPIEKSDVSGIPVPLPILFVIVAIAIVLVFAIPKINKMIRKKL